jgi:tetratricopeptide (TPR) repeat protein
LLAQAVVAYRAALEAHGKADEPREWSRTQNNLGNALVEQSERSSGPKATELLAQAVQAFRAALEVRTKAGMPQEWASTQSSLGIALVGQGERSSGPKAMDLLAQAMSAFHAALLIQTKTDLPLDWARTQNGLGVALFDLGERSGRAGAALAATPGATDFLTEAVQAYRAALKVRTKANLPQDWAATENNLGAALVQQAALSSGTQATDLRIQAVEAYRAALEVYTKADLPQDWAATQNNLGIALVDQGERSSGPKATDLLAQAVQANRAALEVYTRTDLPQDWAMVQNNLGLALRLEGERSSGKQAKDLFAEAVDAYRAALQVYTRTGKPLAWASTQNNLGNALVDEGDYAGAAKALEECLEVFPDNAGFLNTAISIYHDNLYRYDRAYELAQHWLKVDASPDAKIGLLEQDLTTSRFEDCGKQAASIDDDAFPNAPAAMTLIRDSMRMACQWGAGQKAEAQHTANALLLKSAQLQDVDFQFPGTRHFLESSPAFETGRTAWIALFDSLEKGDGAAMAAALRQLDEVMKH